MEKKKNRKCEKCGIGVGKRKRFCEDCAYERTRKNQEKWRRQHGMRPKNSNPFYKELASKIVNLGTIDIEKDLKNYPTIHDKIATKMLEDRSATARMREFNRMRKRVLNSFWKAIDSIKHDIKMPIYILRPNGGNRVLCVSLDPDYKDIKSQHIERVKENMFKSCNAGINDLRITAPEQVKRIANRTSNDILRLKEFHKNLHPRG